MSAKDTQTSTVESAVGFDDDVMARDFMDPQLNNYNEGPGADLPQQFILSNKTDRSTCGVIFWSIPEILEDDGLRNLCNKFGQVIDVQRRWQNKDRSGTKTANAVVTFASLADAENVIYNINKLRFRVNGTVMKANLNKPKQTFKPKLNGGDNKSNCLEAHEMPKSREVVEALNGKEFVKADIKADFHLPLAVPSPLLEPNEIDNQRMKIMLDGGRKFPTIVNGCAIHRHSPEAVAKLEEFGSKSTGSFDEKTQQFVHYSTDVFTASKPCKNCDSPTIKFCKGCKDPFCSMYCLKEYNKGNRGCNCISSKSLEPTKRSRASASRGGKLLSHSTRSWSSASSMDSDQDYQNTDSVIRAKPCDLPKNNKLVTITNVVSNKIVYLRSFEPNDTARYLTHLNDVAEYAKIAPPLDKVPMAGDIVLAEYEGYHYRAWVDRIENDRAIVNLLELGNVISTPINNLKKLRQDLQNIQQFVFKAFLSGMEREGMKTDACLIYLYDLLEKCVPLKFILNEKNSSSDVVECELVVSETNENVAGKLTMLNRGVKLGHGVMIDEMSFKQFDTNASEAVVIDNSLAAKGIITVALPEHIPDIFNMHQRIQEYCKEDYKGPYTPLVNEVCLAKCNDQWYRVKLEKSFGDMNPVMLFLDFALFSKVHVDNMRRMPLELKFPVYPAMAEIGGLTEATDMNKLTETFPSLSKVSVSKVEYLNGNTDEPTIFFNIPGGLPVKGGTSTLSVLPPKRQILENLKKRFSAKLEGH